MNDTRKIKVIGVGGCARAGKDTFVSILINLLQERGYSAKRIAFADPLKGSCDSFCKANLGISAFTQVPEEKLLIRPLLVWFGDAKRKQTNGRFWVDAAEQSILKLDGVTDFAIVSDVRYDHYERDEVSWLKREMNGVLAHVSRYEMEWNHGGMEMKFVEAANDHEAINDPKVRAKADFKLEWPTLPVRVASLINNKDMVSQVERFIPHVLLHHNLPNVKSPLE